MKYLPFVLALLSVQAGAQDFPKNLGLIGDGPQGVEFLLGEAPQGDPDLPSKFNWRDKGGFDWTTPVREQLNCGSCVAFGGISTLEAQLKIDAGLPFWNPVLSVQSLFACGGGDCGRGWSVEAAVEHMKNVGVPDEACLPYAAASGAPACQTQCKDVVERAVKIVDYKMPTTGTIDPAAIKRALLHGPVWTMMSVYTDFQNYHWGVYKHSEGSFWAGHTLAIIGFDDSKKAWIIKNSWSEKWGDHGYGMIHYEDTSGVGTQTWQLILPPRDGYVAIERLQEGRTYSGVVDFPLKGNRTDALVLRLRVLGPDEAEVKRLECQGTQCQVGFDTRELKDGKYDLQPEMVLADREVKGMRSAIVVSNQAPSSKISISPAMATTQAEGREYLSYRIRSASPHAWSKLIFRVSQNGRTVVERETLDVRKDMVIRFNTATVPNGNYEIRITSEPRTELTGFSIRSLSQKIKIQN